MHFEPAQMILLLRDPAKRALSHYNQAARYGNVRTGNHTFPEFVRETAAVTRLCQHLLQDPHLYSLQDVTSSWQAYLTCTRSKVDRSKHHDCIHTDET